jgi:hypothetical protein
MDKVEPADPRERALLARWGAAERVAAVAERFAIQAQVAAGGAERAARKAEQRALDAVAGLREARDVYLAYMLAEGRSPAERP